jgi:hypothetical protein
MALDDQNTVRLLHFNGDIKDESGKTWYPYNGAASSPDRYKFSGSSLFLNNQYIYTSYTADFDLTSTKTIDFWMYPSSISTAPVVLSAGNSQFNNSSYRFQIYTDGSISLLSPDYGETRSSAGVVWQGAWFHVAFVKSGSTDTLYVNGVQVAQRTGTSTSYVVKDYAVVGAYYDTGTGLSISAGGCRAIFNGYIDEVRFSNAVRWTTNFTPPLAPYGAAVDDQNTMSLLHFDGSLADVCGKIWSSTNSMGTSTVSSKFGNGSLYMGSSVLLCQTNDIPAFLANDFSVDFWFSPDTVTTRYDLFDRGYDNNGSMALWVSNTGIVYLNCINNNGLLVVNNLNIGTISSPGTFNHIYIGRSGTKVYASLNGVIKTVTVSSSDSFSSSAFEIGYSALLGTSNYTKGYIDELRVSNVARWTTNFTPPTYAYGSTPVTVPSDPYLMSLLHFDGNLNDTNGRSWTAVNGATTSIAQSKFGNSSLYLNSSNQYLTTQNSTDFDFGNGDFTVDWWEYRTASSGAVFSRDTGNVCSFVLGMVSGGKVAVYLSSARASWDIAAALSMGAVVTNAWTHYALVRKDNTFYTFQSGLLINTLTSTASIAAGSGTPTLGVYSNGSVYFPGYIDEFRVLKGVARWTSNFTVPVRAYSGITLDGKPCPYYISIMPPMMK